MSDTEDHRALQAKVADLERLVAGTQNILQGGRHRAFDVIALQTLYWEACRRYDDPRPREMFLWSCLILNLDVTQLLRLAELVNDPMPWKPFLVLLDYAAAEGYLVDEPTEHVLALARDLLNIQGLWLVQPDDVMGSPLAIQEALSSISK